MTDRRTPRAAALATLRLPLAAGLLAASLAPAAAAERDAGTAKTCSAEACVVLTISEEAVARWRDGRPARALPITGLMGSFEGEREVAVTLLLAAYENGRLSDWTTRPPTVARIGPRGFRADGVRPIVRPGGPAARALPAFAVKHIGAEATLELATPVPGVAAETRWWLQAAQFRDRPPERLRALAPDGDPSWLGAEQAFLIALVPSGRDSMATAVGERWITGTAPLVFRTP